MLEKNDSLLEILFHDVNQIWNIKHWSKLRDIIWLWNF